MTMRIRQSESVAVRARIPIFLVDDTDGKTPEVSVTPGAGELKFCKNGGTWTNGAGTWSNRGEGAYDYTPTASELDTLGYFLVKVVVSGVRLYTAKVQVTTEDPYITRNVRGLVAAGANTASTFVTNLASSITDAYKAPMLVRFLDGALVGQTRPLASTGSFNGTTKALTVSTAFSATPANSTAFEIIGV
jgi:hypothetical protein